MTFPRLGTYLVKLQVRDANGAVSEDEPRIQSSVTDSAGPA